MRYRSIRDLSDDETGVVIQDLKPVWLMSPLSVSDTQPLATKNFDVVIFDEPTRGVDIGTKREIYALIRDMAAAGSIIIWWSTENAELIELCDRIHAFDTEGKPAGELAQTSFTEDGLAELTGMAA